MYILIEIYLSLMSISKNDYHDRIKKRKLVIFLI